MGGGSRPCGRNGMTIHTKGSQCLWYPQVQRHITRGHIRMQKGRLQVQEGKSSVRDSSFEPLTSRIVGTV